MKWIKLLVVLFGIIVVVAQATEWCFNNELADWKKKKSDIYTDFERYLDYRAEAQTLRGVYNILQAVNNSKLNETMIIREKEMLDLVLGSVLVLSNHIYIENKSEWASMDYDELMDVTEQLNTTVNLLYADISNEVESWTFWANSVSAIKFVFLAIDVILVYFDKKK
jgi:hypothetical protein